MADGSWTQSSPTIRDTPLPIPYPPLSWEGEVQPRSSLQLHLRETCQRPPTTTTTTTPPSPPEVSALEAGVDKSQKNTSQCGAIWKKKKIFFFLFLWKHCEMAVWRFALWSRPVCHLQGNSALYRAPHASTIRLHAELNATIVINVVIRCGTK